jgi:predicted negative regulator of RcsB-dependent stress response
MSVYMTEEEQLEALKKWWNKYSNPIVITISIILLAIAGYKYWAWHQEKTTALASSAYEQLMVSFSQQDEPNIQAHANQLIKQYNGTIYADVARLILAKQSITNGNLKQAEEQLRSVASKSPMASMQQVAKIRLARILISQKQYVKAQNELKHVADASYKPMINELRGDIYAATGKYNLAIAAYRKAIDANISQGLGNTFLEMKSNELAAMTQSLNTEPQAIQTA